MLFLVMLMETCGKKYEAFNTTTKYKCIYVSSYHTGCKYSPMICCWCHYYQQSQGRGLLTYCHEIFGDDNNANIKIELP